MSFACCVFACVCVPRRVWLTRARCSGLNDELDQLREALDATEALCERQREEIARLKSGHVPVDHDDARRESELLLIKSRLRATEQDNEQLKAKTADGEARARVALEQLQSQLVAVEREKRQLRTDLDARNGAAQQLLDCRRALDAAEATGKQLREALEVRDAEVTSLQSTREVSYCVCVCFWRLKFSLADD